MQHPTTRLSMSSCAIPPQAYSPVMNNTQLCDTVFSVHPRLSLDNVADELGIDSDTNTRYSDYACLDLDVGLVFFESMCPEKVSLSFEVSSRMNRLRAPPSNPRGISSRMRCVRAMVAELLLDAALGAAHIDAAGELRHLCVPGGVRLAERLRPHGIHPSGTTLRCDPADPAQTLGPIWLTAFPFSSLAARVDPAWPGSPARAMDAPSPPRATLQVHQPANDRAVSAAAGSCCACFCCPLCPFAANRRKLVAARARIQQFAKSSLGIPDLLKRHAL